MYLKPAAACAVSTPNECRPTNSSKRWFEPASMPLRAEECSRHEWW